VNRWPPRKTAILLAFLKPIIGPMQSRPESSAIILWNVARHHPIVDIARLWISTTMDDRERLPHPQPVASAAKRARNERCETVVYIGLNRLDSIADLGTLATPSIEMLNTVVLMRRDRQRPIPEQFYRVSTFVQVITAALDQPSRLRLSPFKRGPN
jgi:hypothetical protein